jgi:hypothetical protein
MAKLTRSKKQSWLDSDRAKAMPQVRQLVKRHGRTIVQWCVNQLRDYEKKVKQLSELKKEAEKLEKEIS